MSSDGTKGPIAIRGIEPQNRLQPPARLELRDMKKNNPDQWNLLLLGMERFMDTQRTKEDDPLSYFQISGIHGRPYSNWPDQEWNKDEKIFNPNRGYCTHSSILFLTWHRPYLSLFETTLYKHVKDIASEYGPDEGRDRYIKAAEEFRLPYWDWARPIDKEVTLFPQEVWSTTLPKILRPGGKNAPEELKYNPLAGYRFGEAGKADARINIFKRVNATLRSPNRDGTSTDTAVTEALQALFNNDKDEDGWRPKGKNLTERTLWILRSYPEFAPMSSNKWEDTDKSWSGWGSLEDIHNSVHGLVGQGGHMNYPEIAAFDPIFWFHHCNIDRLFAIWQALHTEKTDITYVMPTRGTSTRTIDPNEDSTKDTALAPFNTSEQNGDYWTSEGIRDTKTFGYVYPETRDWLFPTADAINAELDKVYKHSTLASTLLASGTEFEETVEELKSRAIFHQQVANTSLNLQTMLEAAQNNQQLPQEIVEQKAKLKLPADRNVGDLVADNKYLEWLVDVKAEKHANNGDFVVHFFLDEPEDNNPQLYVFNPNHVATFTTFGQGDQTECEKCKVDQAAKLEVTGQIPLTLALVERYLSGQVDGLDVTSVEQYLKQHLHWRVTTRTGEAIERSNIESLLVGVVTNEVTLPTDQAGRPQYSPNIVSRPAVTTRRNGDPRGDGTGYIGGEIPTVVV